MKTKKNDKEVTQIINPLAQYDPDQPSYVPKTFGRAYKRSVYFPKEKSVILYKVNQITKEAARAGTKMTFNDVVIEAIELWYQQNLHKYLSWLLHRLIGRKFTLDHKLKKLKVNSKSSSKDREIETQFDKVTEAIAQIEKFLYENRQVIPTGDYDLLITEMIQSLKKHSSNEMNKALSKCLSRSDIYELAAKVRRKPKMKKQIKEFGKGRDEEPEWYE